MRGSNNILNNLSPQKRRKRHPRTLTNYRCLINDNPLIMPENPELSSNRQILDSSSNYFSSRNVSKDTCTPSFDSPRFKSIIPNNKSSLQQRRGIFLKNGTTGRPSIFRKRDSVFSADSSSIISDRSINRTVQNLPKLSIKKQKSSEKVQGQSSYTIQQILEAKESNESSSLSKDDKSLLEMIGMADKLNVYNIYQPHSSSDSDSHHSKKAKQSRRGSRIKPKMGIFSSILSSKRKSLVFNDSSHGEAQSHSCLDASSARTIESVEFKGIKIPRCMISPQNSWKKRWDNYIAVLVIYVVLVLPVKFSFVEEKYLFWDLADYFLDFSFFIDMILNFFSCTFDDDGNIETSRYKVIGGYMRFWFWIDFGSVLPLQLIFSSGELTIFLRVSKLPKLYKILKISKLMRTARTSRKQDTIYKKIKNMIQLNPGIDRLLFNLFTIFIFCHIFACLWHFIGLSNHGNWIQQQGLDDAEVFERYITSLYWIVQTVITVGYGDIPVTGMTEQIIAIMAMFAGVIFFSITIGSLTTVISEMDKRGIQFDKKLSVLVEIRKQYGISIALYNTIHRTIKMRVYRSEESYDSFLTSLPEGLKVELAYKIYKGLVKNILIFQEIQKEFIAEIGPLLKKFTFERGEIIFSEGEHASEMFFVRKGCVSFVLDQYNDKPFMTIGKGNYFGEIDMIFMQSRKFKVVATTNTDLLSFNQQNYQSLVIQKYQKLSSKLRDAAKARRIQQIALHESAIEDALEEEKEEMERRQIESRRLRRKSKRSGMRFTFFTKIPDVKSSNESNISPQKSERSASFDNMASKSSRSCKSGINNGKSGLLKIRKPTTQKKAQKRKSKIFFRRTRQRLGTNIYKDVKNKSEAVFSDKSRRENDTRPPLEKVYTGLKEQDTNFEKVEDKIEELFNLLKNSQTSHSKSRQSISFPNSMIGETKVQNRVRRTSLYSTLMNPFFRR